MLDRIIASRVFVETVERGTATAAAEALGMSRAMASRYLAAMEDWAGTRLLHRSTRHMSLTLAGENLLPQCRSLIGVADGIQGASAEDQAPQGWLRVAMPGLFADSCLLPLLRRFNELYPKIIIDLQVSDRAVDLVQDRIDVAVRIATKLDKAVIASRLGTVRSVLCASADYVAQNGSPEQPEQLEQHPCLSYTHFGGHEWRLHKDDKTTVVQVSGPLQTNEGLLLLRGALNGLGITRLPMFAVGGPLSQGKLVPILDGWHPPDLGLYSLYASRQHLPASTRVFIDFMAEQLHADPLLHPMP